MSGIGLTLLYFVVAVIILIIGVLLFEVVTTAYKDWEEIAEGNYAVALSIGGKIIGLCIILMFAILENSSLWGMIAWGVLGIVLQIIVYYLFDLLTIKFSVQRLLKERNLAVGIISFSVSVGLAFVIGASIT